MLDLWKGGLIWFTLNLAIFLWDSYMVCVCVCKRERVSLFIFNLYSFFIYVETCVLSLM